MSTTFRRYILPSSGSETLHRMHLETGDVGETGGFLAACKRVVPGMLTDHLVGGEKVCTQCAKRKGNR